MEKHDGLYFGPAYMYVHVHRGSMSQFLFTTGSYLYLNTFVLAFGIWAIIAADSVDAVLMVSDSYACFISHHSYL